MNTIEGNKEHRFTYNNIYSPRLPASLILYAYIIILCVMPTEEIRLIGYIVLYYRAKKL